MPARTAVNLCALSLMLAGTAAWAQDRPRSTDISTWTIPNSAPPRTLPVQWNASRTTPTGGAYVNPTTGAVVPVPPPPPRVASVDEWTPVKAAMPEEVGSIRPALFQQPPDKEKSVRVPGEPQEVQIQLEPPGPDVVFKRESERDFMERLRQLARQQKTTRFEFPDEPVLSTEKYAGRSFPPSTQLVEPNYLCYGRLLFEDLNSERYGWDLGFIQPFVSGGRFLWDMALLPYHTATAPCRCFECNGGYCLPGDPVPYLLYPPELSLTGAAWEAAVIVALFAIFPG